jgi:hypothetical protein
MHTPPLLGPHEKPRMRGFKIMPALSLLLEFLVVKLGWKFVHFVFAYDGEFFCKRNVIENQKNR